jgi:hypothetical protein
MPLTCDRSKGPQTCRPRRRSELASGYVTKGIDAGQAAGVCGRGPGGEPAGQCPLFLCRRLSSCTSAAADKAEQSLQSFFKAHGMPDVSDAAAAVGWCRLAVARARMDRADEMRGTTAVHASLQEAYAWASEAVRGRAFPVAFASSHGRNAVAQATRADMISAWYCRAFACFNDQDAAGLHTEYRKLLRMQ